MKKSILTVDDEASIVELLRQSLEDLTDEGHPLHIAVNGTEAQFMIALLLCSCSPRAANISTKPTEKWSVRITT